MKHDRILTQNGFLGVLRKLHKLNKTNAKQPLDELVVEIINDDILEKIEVPDFLFDLANKNKISIQDMINIILKLFTIEYVKGKDYIDKNFIAFLNTQNLKGK